MRNITKFKRSIRAISPVISVLLMIAIAVVASLVAYAWVMGYMNFQADKAGKAIQIPSFAVNTDKDLVIYVQNVGQGTAQIGPVYVNNELKADFTNDQTKSATAGNTVELIIAGDYDASKSYEIKVTTTDGTFMTVSGKPGSGGAPVAPAALTASVSPVGPLTMTNGQTQIFTASSTGGTGAKSFQWYIDGSAVSGEVAQAYTYTVTSGAHEIYVKVTDSAATPVSDDSNTVTVTGADVLTASIIPEGTISLTDGQPQTFTANVAGGIGTKTYQWYLDNAAVTDATGSTYEYTAETAGSTHTVYVKVTDSASTPITVDSNTVSITVASDLTVAISPNGPLTMDATQTQTFTSTVTGGIGTKSYQWYLDGSAVSGSAGTGTSYTYTASTTGSPHSVYLKVTDSASTTVSVNSNAVTITVNSVMTVNVNPTGQLTKNVGQTQTFTVTVNGGSGSKSYQWYLDGSAVSGSAGTGTSYTYTATSGSHNVYCRVTDSASNPSQVNSNTVSITVNSALVAPTISTNDAYLRGWETATFSSTTVNTGTSPYSYQWLRMAPGQSEYSEISGATSTSYQFQHRDNSPSTAHGDYYFELRVTDNTGAVVTSNSVKITVGN